MLKGKKISLRAIERSDLAKLLEWRNKPKNRRFFREYRELSSDNQSNWYDDIVMKDNSVRMFAIIDESGLLLGACGLCYIDWINRSADFSIYIGENDLYIDKTYAVDAARVMIEYGFGELNLHRLWAEIYDFDDKKIEFLESLGFSLEGRHKETHWTEGRWCDSLFFGLLRCV